MSYVFPPQDNQELVLMQRGSSGHSELQPFTVVPSISEMRFSVSFSITFCWNRIFATCAIFSASIITQQRETHLESAVQSATLITCGFMSNCFQGFICSETTWLRGREFPSFFAVLVWCCSSLWEEGYKRLAVSVFHETRKQRFTG